MARSLPQMRWVTCWINWSSRRLLGRPLLTAESFLQRARVVQVQDAAFFIRLDDLNAAGMRPNNRACSCVERRIQQFFVQRRGKNNGMSPPAFVDRQNDGLAGCVESFHQLADKRGANQRMINQK